MFSLDADIALQLDCLTQTFLQNALSVSRFLFLSKRDHRGLVREKKDDSHPEVALDVAAQPEVFPADVADVSLLAAVAHGGVVVEVGGVAENAVAVGAAEGRRDLVAAVPRQVQVEAPLVPAETGKQADDNDEWYWC